MNWGMFDGALTDLADRGDALLFPPSNKEITMSFLSTSTSKGSKPSNAAADLFRDTALTARIKGQLMSKDRFDGTDISVSTLEGRVTLDGQVSTVAQREWAESVCMAVEGVTSVHNALNVVPAAHAASTTSSDHGAQSNTERMASDTWLTTKVKTELLADSLTHSFQIHVKTFHGVVSLHGEVSSARALHHVMALVAAIEGVNRVDSAGLKVKHEML